MPYFKNMVDGALYSPFHSDSFTRPGNEVLLLQFITAEICATHNPVNPADIFRPPLSFFSFAHLGHWHKLQEHALLLAPAFSRSLSERFLAILAKMDETNFQLQCKKLFFLIEPLFQIYKDNENLLYFFLRYQEKIGQLLYPNTMRCFMLGLHTQGIDKLRDTTCQKFTQRGFSSVVPHLTQLFSHV